MRFPSTLKYDKAELEELIWARINQVFALTGVTTLEDQAEARAGAALPKNFLTTYDLYDESPPMYNINSFQQIGMTDPFPAEDVGFHPPIPETYTDYVYPEARMNDPEASPMCIYVPNRIITLKLMRACIDVR